MASVTALATCLRMSQGARARMDNLRLLEDQTVQDKTVNGFAFLNELAIPKCLRLLALEISEVSLGSSQILRLPHFKTLAASRFSEKGSHKGVAGSLVKSRNIPSAAEATPFCKRAKGQTHVVIN